MDEMIIDGSAEMGAEALMSEALRWADRREHLCRHAPGCPTCGSPQVQLIDHFVSPAAWRCRECNHIFAFEQEPGSKSQDCDSSGNSFDRRHKP